MHRIREDFDRIALLTEQHGALGDVYHRYLQDQLPARCECALEIGCGTGAFTRLVAARSRRVIGIDLSPQMIRFARQQSGDCPNIQYVLGDVMQQSLPAEGYDCIVSLATLHHLPLHETMVKMKDALTPGGTLIIHDLTADEHLLDKVISGLAYPVSCAWRLWKTGRPWMPRVLRKAWAEHGKDETYLTWSEVNSMQKQHLPGAGVRRHLLWRYTVVWHKESE
jgi:SAM-dependent methyltransferase